MKPSLGPLCFQYSTKFIIIITIIIISIIIIIIYVIKGYIQVL